MYFPFTAYKYLLILSMLEISDMELDQSDGSHVNSLLQSACIIECHLRIFALSILNFYNVKDTFWLRNLSVVVNLNYLLYKQQVL